MTGTLFSLEVQPRIPNQLARLEELATDLLYSWDRNVRALFYRLDIDLWQSCGHSPKVFLRRVSQQRLEQAVQDQAFMEDYTRVLSVYDSYLQQTQARDLYGLEPASDLIAYFCAEFGFHESLPIYSGGLGILAGDHCKAASDLAIPFVAMGLLYRQGYFTQTIDNLGNQVAHYATTDFADLPIVPALDKQGNELHVNVTSNGYTIHIKVWEARAGRIKLYLLDTDVSENDEKIRSITHRLYGGDKSTRILQEIVLGIGGVRALIALGLNPTVWHINEGHSAFQIVERCAQYLKRDLDFDSALELVAAGTVFTTHTPVPAGHDIFEHHLIDEYLDDYETQLSIDRDKFLSLGASPGNEGSFNMTALALRGSRFQNGVSRIHGGMASQMEGYVWPQIPYEENPISYVTNGVHVPTFLAREWVNLFDMHFREWRNELNNPDYWQCIDSISDHRYWSLRQSLKGEMMEHVLRRATHQLRRNGSSEAQVKRLTRFIEPRETDILTVGFARRFATYKRAALLFSDPERLSRILNDPQRPVMLVFAGKAHPNDKPGQHLIRIIHEFSRRQEFEGRILLLEGYDMSLARKLVAGVDVWLNTPEYPMEASGTSGEKAGINGVVNLSVLDGWWGEGYTGDNGWAIAPHGQEFEPDYRNQEEAKDLLDIIENDVVPLYYERDGRGYSEKWVRISKASMRTIIPNFNAQRMAMDYVKHFYTRASKHHKQLCSNNNQPARALAQWKKKIAQIWPAVKIRRIDESDNKIFAGSHLAIRVAVELADLNADDVIVECIVGIENKHNEFRVHEHFILAATDSNENGETLFSINLQPNLSGRQFYKIRMYPSHHLLANRFEVGYMLWL
ncbi:MAG: glycosyltransferase family 1 protein [Gammaproteobacteria bacterium]|nr:glycosyltransferase family 1 protein [Gammaproteobacteria bacterium]